MVPRPLLFLCPFDWKTWIGPRSSFGGKWDIIGSVEAFHPSVLFIVTSGLLGWLVESSSILRLDTLKGDLDYLGWNCPSGFRGEELSEFMWTDTTRTTKTQLTLWIRRAKNVKNNLKFFKTSTFSHDILHVSNLTIKLNCHGSNQNEWQVTTWTWDHLQIILWSIKTN